MPLLAQHCLQGCRLRVALLRLLVHVQNGLVIVAVAVTLLGPVCFGRSLVVDLQWFEVQELGQRLRVLLGVAVYAVLASCVRALELCRELMADGAVDEVVRLVRRAVAAVVQAEVAMLAEAVPALRTVTVGDAVALRPLLRRHPVAHAGGLHAVELAVELGVELLAGVRLEGHLLQDRVLRTLVVHNLQAPFHLLGIELSLMVHLGESLEKGLQCPDHEGLLFQLHLENLAEDLHVFRRDQRHLGLDVRLRLRLVGPQHAVDAQLDVLLRGGAAAMVQQLREVVVVRVLRGRLVRLVVEVADHRAHSLERSPRLWQLDLREALQDPLVLRVPLLICVQIGKPLLQARALAHAAQHRHLHRLLQRSLGCGIGDAEEPQGVCV
mmetsp:Transcript_19482/g.58707  ORF Transcript_19482/g.58707 Transcript_19482/m.58707 type:complete len:381 (-) Transcript_19482:257-1399(-)